MIGGKLETMSDTSEVAATHQDINTISIHPSDSAPSPSAPSAERAECDGSPQEVENSSDTASVSPSVPSAERAEAMDVANMTVIALRTIVNY